MNFPPNSMRNSFKFLKDILSKFSAGKFFFNYESNSLEFRVQVSSKHETSQKLIRDPVRVLFVKLKVGIEQYLSGNPVAVACSVKMAAFAVSSIFP